MPAVREVARKAGLTLEMADTGDSASAYDSAFDTIALDIITIAGEADLVLAERVDRFTLKGKYFELPVNGVFEIKNGKIHRFSDYFDLATFEGHSGFKL